MLINFGERGSFEIKTGKGIDKKDFTCTQRQIERKAFVCERSARLCDVRNVPIKKMDTDNQSLYHFMKQITNNGAEMTSTY